MISFIIQFLVILGIQVLKYIEQKKKAVPSNTTTKLKICTKKFKLSITKDNKSLVIILKLA